MSKTKRLTFKLIAAWICFHLFISSFLTFAAQESAPNTTNSTSSTNTVFFVSPTGNDSSGNGSIEAPFKTITKARDTVRQLIANGMTSDIIVYIRGGNYYLDSPIVFTPEDSGKNGFKVIYKNYNDEQPIINGGQSVTNWTPEGNNIYKAKISNVKNFYTLFENGERSVLARYPNQGAPREGYLRVAEMVDKNPNYQFKFAPNEIPHISNITDLQVNYWPGGTNGEFNWQQDRHGVTSIDYDECIISLDGRTNYEMGKGSRYFLQGAKEFLDAPGEFYFDSTTSTLYYYPRKLPIEEQDIVYPKMSRIIEFRGHSETALTQNIVLEGLTIRNSDTTKSSNSADDIGAIDLRNTRNITIKDCIIHNAGVHGIYMHYYNQENIIYGNSIHDVGYSGISLFAGWVTSKYVSKKNIIQNNHIYNIGQISGGEPGISLTASGENIVSHNLIHDGNRAAITIGAAPVIANILGKNIDGILATEENMYDFSQSRKNRIEFNDISRMNMDSQDSGIFYTWGPGKDNIVNNNHLHDSNIYFSFGFGLYLDDESGHFTVTNNIISDLQKSGGGTLNGSLYTKSVENKLFNNFIINTPNAQTGYLTTGPNATHGPTKDITFERNIIYNGGKDLHGTQGWTDDKFKSFDYNLYYNENGIYTTSQTKKASLEEWKTVLNNKFDQHSIVADPGFMAPEQGDYRLRYDSIAPALGINDIDTYSIGLKEDFKYVDKNDPLDRLFLMSDTNGIKSYVDLNTSTTKKAKLTLKGRSVIGYPYDLSDAEISYVSSDPTVAEVSSDGVIEAKSDGVATITATVVPKAQEALPNNLQSKLKNAIALRVGNSYTYVNGKLTPVDTENPEVVPIVQNGRTLLPLRFIAETLGCNVDWNEAEQKIRMESDKYTIIMNINDKEYMVNRRKYTMDEPPQIINGRTMVPLRTIATALKKQVFWDESGIIVISDIENIFNKENDDLLIKTLNRMFPSPLSISITALVNDSFDSVVAYTDRTVLKPDEVISIQAFGKTKYGRYLDLKDAKITYTSSNNNIASVDNNGAVTSKNMGTANITAAVEMNGITKKGTATVNVVDAIIEELNISLKQAALSPGNSTEIVLTGKLSNNEPLKKEEVQVTYESSNPEVVTVDENGIVTAHAEGKSSIVATVNRSGSVSKTSLNVIIFKDDPDSLPKPWKVKNYGNASGTATTLDGSEFIIYSNGYDVWGNTDECTYLYQETNSTKEDEVSITAHIGPMTNTHKDAASGLMFRSSDSADAKIVHTRLLPNGTTIIVMRKEQGGGCDYAVGPSFSFPEGATLRMTKKGTTVSLEYLRAGTWYNIMNVDIDLGDNVLAGIGIFSHDNDQIMEAKIGSPTVEVKKASKK